jgi:hypothetical protein
MPGREDGGHCSSRPPFRERFMLFQIAKVSNRVETRTAQPEGIGLGAESSTGRGMVGWVRRNREETRRLRDYETTRGAEEQEDQESETRRLERLTGHNRPWAVCYTKGLATLANRASSTHATHSCSDTRFFKQSLPHAMQKASLRSAIKYLTSCYRTRSRYSIFPKTVIH